MDDLFVHDGRYVAKAPDVDVIGVQPVYRDGDDFLVRPAFVCHNEATDRTASNHCKRNNRNLRDDEDVARVAIITKRLRNEATVGRINHRCVQETVDKQRPRDFVLNWNAALRDLDNGIYFKGRVFSRRKSC
jgi:hypothetical protein